MLGLPSNQDYPGWIFIYSKATKHILLDELTVSWETNIPKDQAIKNWNGTTIYNTLVSLGVQ